MGLTQPDIYSEINEFILNKYNSPEPQVKISEYLEDLNKILFAYQQTRSEKRKELIEDLKQLNIIYSRNNSSGEKKYLKASQVYLQSDDLIEYFYKYNLFNVVSEEVNRQFMDNNDILYEMLLIIGCENKPRQIKINPSLSYNEKRVLRDYKRYTKEIQEIDYEYEGLENFFNSKKISINRSCILWKFMLKSIASITNWECENFFHGEYRWFYYNELSSKFDSKILKLLKITRWIIDKDDKYVLPSEICIYDLPECYDKKDKNIDILACSIGTKIDEIRQIEDKYGGIFIQGERKEEYNKFKKWEDEQRKKKLENDREWLSVSDPESLNPIAVELELKNIQNIVRVSQRLSDNNDDSQIDKCIECKPEESRIEISREKLIEIGNWGERFVRKHLMNKYSNERSTKVIWKNENGEIGYGYDFEIFFKSGEIYYIEVKSKIDSNPQLIQITGAQWEFSRELFNRSEGDKYHIYVVCNVGSEHAKIEVIKNPIKLWKEGKLYAHPIQIKL
jgi:hypothetical protein